MRCSVFFIASTLGCLLGGCANEAVDEGAPKSWEDKRKLGFGSVIGNEQGIVFGGDGISGRSTKRVGVANIHLWRASLSVLSDIPLQSVDAAGGVITTDWHPFDKNRSLQMKVTVYIDGPVLEAKALRVIVHKREIARDGTWKELGCDAQVCVKIEDAILTQARQFRILETKS